jgi:hypothetical protein
MLPERGGAGYFTLLVADRLADLNREVGRPVRLEELVNALADTPSLPWSYLITLYQQRQEVQHPQIDGRAHTCTIYVDIRNNPKQRYAVLRYAVKTRIRDAVRNGGRGGRRWVIEHPDGTLERNPDPAQQPRVRFNGQYYDWTEETRRASEALATDQVKGISKASAVRRFSNIAFEDKVMILRRLAKLLPAEDRLLQNGFHRVFKSKSALWPQIEKIVGDDPEAILAMIHELTEP